MLLALAVGYMAGLEHDRPGQSTVSGKMAPDHGPDGGRRRLAVDLDTVSRFPRRLELARPTPEGSSKLTRAVAPGTGKAECPTTLGVLAPKWVTQASLDEWHGDYRIDADTPGALLFCMCAKNHVATGHGAVHGIRFGQSAGWSLFPAACGDACSCTPADKPQNFGGGLDVIPLFRASGVKSALTASARRGKPGWIVQIGAHVGFEDNDPIASPLLAIFAEMARDGDTASAGIAAEWLMVEASPVNYAGLVKTVERHRGNLSNHVRFLPTNVGVLAGNSSASPGDESEERNMTFYSMSSDIDPESGRDKRTGKQLPFWATQLGSFNKQHQNFLHREFSRQGLLLQDYLVESDVRVLTMPRLLKEHNIPQESVALVLIDTEGFDCDIVLSLNLTKAFKPRMLVFEHKICPSKRRDAALSHLAQAGYTTAFDNENTFATLTLDF